MSMHYEALGVPEDVTPEDLRRAWREAARRWHPDHRGSGSAVNAQDAEALFKRASDAWAILRDAALRSEYDEALRVARMPRCSVCGSPSLQPVCVLCALSFSMPGAAFGHGPVRARSAPQEKPPVVPRPPPRAKPVRPKPPPQPRAADPVYPDPDPSDEPRAGRAAPEDAWDDMERALFEQELRDREAFEARMAREAEARDAVMRESASFLGALMGGKTRAPGKKRKPLSLEVPLGPGFRVVIDSEAAERIGDVNDGLRLANRLFKSVSQIWKR